MNPNRKRIVEITTTGLFIAIIVVMTFVPNLGYITIGTLSITTIHVPVIIGSALLGPIGGLILGFTWGLTSFIKVFVAAVSPIELALFSNPLISILPRILVGLLVALAAGGLTKLLKKDYPRDIAIAVLGTVLNTTFVLGAIGIFAGGTLFPQDQTLTTILKFIIGTNGLVEIGVAVLLVPVILSRLRKVIRN